MCVCVAASQGAGSEVRGKVGGAVELECGSSYSSLHVVEWVRQGVDTPVLIKFGIYGPRVNPAYEGESPSWSRREGFGDVFRDLLDRF